MHSPTKPRPPVGAESYSIGPYQCESHFISLLWYIPQPRNYCVGRAKIQSTHLPTVWALRKYVVSDATL